MLHMDAGYAYEAIYMQIHRMDIKLLLHIINAMSQSLLALINILHLLV